MTLFGRSSTWPLMMPSFPLVRANLVNSCGSVAPGTSVTMTLEVSCGLTSRRRAISWSSLSLLARAFGRPAWAGVRAWPLDVWLVFRVWEPAANACAGKPNARRTRHASERLGPQTALCWIAIEASNTFISGANGARAEPAERSPNMLWNPIIINVLHHRSSGQVGLKPQGCAVLTRAIHDDRCRRCQIPQIY